jgi:2-(3-amino-3-carboxypropyl)histidine synthase
MRILLQFPEGLKQKALEHAKKIEKEGNEVLISASPCFGACDLALDEAKAVNAEKLIHFGHAEFNKVDFNVEYIEYKIDAPLEILKDSLTLLEEFGRLGIVTTIQHVHQLGAIKEFYQKEGKSVSLGKPYGFAKKEGQILGCDAGSAATIDKDVDVHIYFGGGLFHPLGAVLNTTKPFLSIDPFMGKMEFLDSYREKYRKRSRGRILAALNAKSFGILVSTKNGQFNMKLAEILKTKIEEANLAAEILVSNTFDFSSLDNLLEFDAFVNTACPRLVNDDSIRIRKPLLSSNELIESLGIITSLRK